MSGIKDPAYPSSVAFEEIHRVLTSDESVKKDAIKNAKGIYAFTLKNSSNATQSWHIDLKDKGVVAKGLAPAGGKPDVELQLKDSDFQALVEGKAKAQQLFMSGKLKVKGNVMKATKLDPILAKSRSKAKI